jgi:hypothetical protein
MGDTRDTIDFGGVGPAIGRRLPEIRLPDQSGRVLDLHAYLAGRPALVVVFRSARW